MKVFYDVNKMFFVLILCFFSKYSLTQTRVAILDFENISGIAKYDGFGKAMSNMLITDLKNSIHPKKVTFLERSQLNKILEEQGLQKSKNFDNNTAVNFGKLAGVKYVVLGNVYVLDGICNLSARLVDVETSEIVYAKESNGKIEEWLGLKTVLAEELSVSLNNPVTIEDQFANQSVTEGTISQYSKVINKMDEGDTEGAQQMAEMLTELQPDFRYFQEVQADIENLKKEIELLKVKVEEAVEDPYGLALDKLDHYKYQKAIEYLSIAERQLYETDEMYNNQRLFIYTLRGMSYYYLEKYDNANDDLEKALEIFPWMYRANVYYILSLLKLEHKQKAKEVYLRTSANINYYFTDSLKEKYSGVIFDTGNHLYDGFDYLANDLFVSSSDFSTYMTRLLGEENLEFNFSMVESVYNNFVEKLNSFKGISQQDMLNYYHRTSDTYFQCVNNYAWEKMLEGKYEFAQSLIEENLLLLYNLEYPTEEDAYHKYEEGRNKYPVRIFGDSDVDIPVLSGIYLLGNLLTCYAVNGEVEKSKLIYCDLKEGESRFFKQSPNDAVLLNKFLPQIKKTYSDLENLNAMLNNDFKDLKLDKAVLQNIIDCNCNHYSFQRDWYMILEDKNLEIENGSKYRIESNNFMKQISNKKGAIQTKSGLVYEELKKGEGSYLENGENVTLDIRHTLSNGEYVWNGYLQGLIPQDSHSINYIVNYQIDSENVPSELYFNGEILAIDGLIEALKLMKLGSRLRVYVPYSLGLNDYSNFEYPPYTIHIYEVEVINVN